jgi:hypothetical protein
MGTSTMAVHLSGMLRLVSTQTKSKEGCCKSETDHTITPRTSLSPMALHQYGFLLKVCLPRITNSTQGDPYANSVILWTRASPVLENDRSNVTVEGLVPYFSHETEKYIKASKSPICLDWKMSSSQDMLGPVVSSGRAYTTSDIDYTVKVRVL